VPAEKLVDVQVELGKQRSGPLTQGGGSKGMTGNPDPGGFGPVLDGSILPHHPFDPKAPDISKNKPLIVGYNHDEMNFFFAQSRSTDIYEMDDAALRARLEKDLGAKAGTVLEAYKKSRPEASPADLYVAIATARFAGVGERTIAERKFAQHGAPVYLYVFRHESDRLIPGTQHKMGAAHAAEIAYKFNNVQARPANAAPPQAGGPMGDSGPSSVQAAHNMSEFWSTFARTGRPAAKGQPMWPAYNDKVRPTMMIDAVCKVINDPDPLERQVWNRIDAV
jgi:para-nitrobenzyl esterase